MGREPKGNGNENDSARSVAVRPGRSADAAALAAIAHAAYAEYVPLIGREPPPMLQDFPADIADGACWVAGDPPDGYVVARPKGDDWLIENVAVAAAAQGRVLARLLMAFAEDEGRRRGFRRAVLYTHVAMTRNRALYPALGYMETGERTEHGLHRVYFVKELG